MTQPGVTAPAARWSGLAAQRELLHVAAPLALAAACLDGSFGFFLIVLQAFLPDTVHASVSATGYALGLYGATRVLLQGPGGVLARRFGASRLIVLGIVGGAGALLVLAAADTPREAYVLVVAYGTATAMSWPAIYLRAGDLVAEKRGALFSIVTLCALGGAALGLGSGAILVDRFSSRALIIGIGLALATGGLAVWLLTHLRRPRHASAAHVLDAAIRPIRRHGLARLFGALAFQGLGMAMLLPLLRQYAHERLEVEMQHMLVLALPAGLFAMLALLIAGQLTDRIGRAPVVAAGTLLAASGMWWLSASDANDMFVLSAILLASGYAACAPALGAWISDVSDNVGGAVGLALTVQGVAFAIGPALTGFVLLHGGMVCVLWIAASALLVAGVTAIVPARAFVRVRPGEISW